MTVFVSCPQCSQAVDPQSRTCEYCGVDLALAAVIAERTVMPIGPIPAGMPLAPEILVPRIGDYLIEQGVLRPADLQHALDYQKEQTANGRSLLVGQALLELGLVDRETLDNVITTQILQLQIALSEANHQLERRVLERTQDLQHALERLAELNQLKANFIANISHELRTPLTHLKGYLDLLSDQGLGPLTDQQSDAVKVLKRAEGRLERLIEDLIQFSLVSRGELSLKVEQIDLSGVIKQVTTRMMGNARQVGVILILNAPPTCPFVEADVEKISWVISQLLDNALKFTPKGGKVEVHIQVSNRGLKVAVSDTGIGIPQDRIQEIFEPFHQLDGSATRRYGGTGLGLAMVKRIIEAHGSSIQVQSVLGRGTRFEFSLPLVRQSP